MENFLRDPAPEEASKLVLSAYAEKTLCVKIPYDPDSVIFSALLTKYFNGEVAVTFSSDCQLTLNKGDIGNSVAYRGVEVFVGSSAFSSLLPLTVEDLVPILAGIFSDVLLRRRKPSDWEQRILNNAENLGVIREKGLKIPAYREVPLFLSLFYSLDPFVPDISGNPVNALKLVKELNGNEFTKLSDLDESKLNTLLFRLVSSLVKVNPKATREDVIDDRYFYNNYDSLELGMSVLYVMDTQGSPILFDAVMNTSLFWTFVEWLRGLLSRGFNVQVSEEGNRYVVDSNLSPILAYIVLRQAGKAKDRRPVYLRRGEKFVSSRFFLNSPEEGLIYDDKD